MSLKCQPLAIFYKSFIVTLFTISCGILYTKSGQYVFRMWADFWTTACSALIMWRRRGLCWNDVTLWLINLWIQGPTGIAKRVWILTYCNIPFHPLWSCSPPPLTLRIYLCYSKLKCEIEKTYSYARIVDRAVKLSVQNAKTGDLLVLSSRCNSLQMINIQTYTRKSRIDS